MKRVILHHWLFEACDYLKSCPTPGVCLRNIVWRDKLDVGKIAIYLELDEYGPEEASEKSVMVKFLLLAQKLFVAAF
jgi:hypothetical protein